MRSRLEQMSNFAGILCNHRELILDWFRAKRAVSASTVERLNDEVKQPA
ncbi:MAG: hypothetical protein IT427_09220 [Pirellulales bacterium]|nr:hypothetical protein [Pirellulales bacterium]